MSTHTAGPMEAARAAWVRIGRAKPNGDVDIFRKADAEMRLIASAPDLLAALIECEDLLAELATGGAENPELEMVRAAISRATGGKLAAT